MWKFFWTRNSFYFVLFFPGGESRFTSPHLTWCNDRPWESRIHSVLILSPSPRLALTGPNTCIQTPAAQPINHCRLIQYNRKFAQGARLGHYQCSVPIYFGSVLFSKWTSDIEKLICQSLKTEIETVMLFVAIMVWIDENLIWTWVSFYSFTDCCFSPLGNVSAQLCTSHTRFRLCSWRPFVM